LALKGFRIAAARADRQMAYRHGVARPVELADVLAQIERYGPLASLLTVTPDGRPHVGTVLVTERAGRLDLRVGSRTRDNIAGNPRVSLAWVREDVDYQLIIDGTAEVDGSPGTSGADGLHAVAIAVERGILHRLAGRPEAGPSCRSLSVATGAPSGPSS